MICDRFVDSTRVYQGIGRDNLRAEVDALHDLMIGQEPDLTVLVDLNPELGLNRALERGGDETRFESFGLELQQKLRAGFLACAEAAPDRIIVIDGEGSMDEVHTRILSALDARG